MSLEERVADLESRLSFQDDTLQVLSDELVAQKRQLDWLQAQLGQLARRQEELSTRIADGALDEPPPPHF